MILYRFRFIIKWFFFYQFNKLTNHIFRSITINSHIEKLFESLVLKFNKSIVNSVSPTNPKNIYKKKDLRMLEKKSGQSNFS